MDPVSVTRSTFVSGLMMALLGIVAVTWLIPTHVIGANSDTGNLTPGFMPRVAAWSMIILGAVVAVNALRVMVGQIPAVLEESEENETLKYGRSELVDSVIIIVLSALYVLLMTRYGFLFPSAAVLGLVAYFAGFRKPLILAVVAIGFPAFLEFLLWHVLKIPLPQFPLINF